LGTVPNERSVEGIRLALDGGGGNFGDEAGGRTMFLAVRRAASAVEKAQGEEKAPEPSDQPHN
jgi:hypothetical protein